MILLIAIDVQDIEGIHYGIHFRTDLLNQRAHHE